MTFCSKHEVDAGQALRVLRTLAGGQSSSALSRLANAAAGTKLKVGDLIGAEVDATDGLAQGLDASVVRDRSRHGHAGDRRRRPPDRPDHRLPKPGSPT
jgi:hypothetical protein